MKTYILKYEVNNGITFPVGTIVSITDDYWGGSNDKNTGFTVMEGELKGEKGCVADGLHKWLIDDNKENRLRIESLQYKKSQVKNLIDHINSELESLKAAKI